MHFYLLLLSPSLSSLMLCTALSPLLLFKLLCWLDSLQCANRICIVRPINFYRYFRLAAAVCCRRICHASNAYVCAAVDLRAHEARRRYAISDISVCSDIAQLLNPRVFTILKWLNVWSTLLPANIQYEAGSRCAYGSKWPLLFCHRCATRS